MVKLANSSEMLEGIIRMMDNSVVGPGKLVAVSDLTDPAGIDSKAIPWRTHVIKDYRVQRAAIAAGVLKKAAALPPHFAIDVLKDNDPDNDFYTVMSIEIPSGKHTDSILAIAIIRPDVNYFKDGEPHIKMWFNSIIDPAYHSPSTVNLAYLENRSGKKLLTDLLREKAIERFAQLTGENPLIFSDDQSTDGKGIALKGYRFLLGNVQVSSLPERRKRFSDTPANTVNLLVKPGKYAGGLPFDKASELVVRYLVDGYEAPENGKLVKQAIAQLRQHAVHGVVQYQ